MKVTRESHQAGVERLNKVFGLDEKHIALQQAFFARRAAKAAQTRRPR